MEPPPPHTTNHIALDAGAGTQKFTMEVLACRTPPPPPPAARAVLGSPTCTLGEGVGELIGKLPIFLQVTKVHVTRLKREFKCAHSEDAG